MSESEVSAEVEVVYRQFKYTTRVCLNRCK